MPAKIKQNTSREVQKQAKIALAEEKFLELLQNDSVKEAEQSTNLEETANNSTKEIEKNLNDYLLAVKNTGCSAATIRNYKSDIKQFLNFLGESSLDALGSKPKLLAFAKYQREKGLKDSSIKRKIVGIGQFKNWLKAEGLLKSEIPLSQKQVENASSLDLRAIDSRRAQDQEIKAQQLLAQQLLAEQNQALRDEDSAKLSQEAKKKPNWFGRAKETDIPAHRRPNKLALILNIIALLFFIGGLGYLAYQQFGQAVLSLAYPSLPTNPNRILSFQGRLTNTARTPIATETDMTYALYDDVTGGNLLWSSNTCAIIPDQDGIFSTNLGAGNGDGSDDLDCGGAIDDSVFTENSNVWLEVSVGTSPSAEILSPRQPIRTVAYAINSETVQGIRPSLVATHSTLLMLNDQGQLVLGTDNPEIKTVSGSNLTIEANSITMQTQGGSNGDIILSPDGTGNVGIGGATDPSGTLHTAGSAVGTNWLALFTQSGVTPEDSAAIASSQNAAVAVQGAGKAYFLGRDVTNDIEFIMGTSTAGGAFAGSMTNHDFWLRTNNVNRMTIQAGTGNIGIGTTSPAYLLDVAGDINTTGTYRIAGIDYGQYFIDSAGTSGQVWKSDGSGRGYWGIDDTGTALPVGTLAGQTVYWNGTSWTYSSNLFNNNTNVGIGTTNPLYKLDVAGDINLTGALRANGSSGTSGQILISQGASTPVWSDVSGVIDDYAFIQGGNSFGATAVLGTNDNYNLQFKTNGTSKMSIGTDGKVGIGTNSPKAKLHLMGSVQQANYPVVEASTSGEQTQSTTFTSYVASLPTGIQAGDLLIIIVRSGGSSTTHSLPGWTQIATRDSSGRTTVFAKIAQGSDTATITLGAGRNGIAHTAYRISGVHDSSSVTDVIEATFANSNTIDPPNLTVSWTSENNLFIAGMSTRRSTGNNITSAPTSFTNLLNQANTPSSDGTNYVRVGSAEREYATGSLNPGSFTTTGTTNSTHALTIAVRSLMVEEEDLFRIDDENSINKFIVKTDGNVGIGATAPSTLLQLGQAGTAGTLGIAGSTSGLVTLQTAATTDDWTMTLPTGAGTSGQVLTTDGSGVTSWTSLDHSIKWNAIDNPDGHQVLTMGAYNSTWNFTSGALRITNDSAEALYVGGGNVGIGTTTPSEKLTLNGGNFLHTASGNPTLKGTFNTSGNAYGVYVSGKYAYVADYGAGLQIIDVSNPAAPSLTGNYDTSGNAYDVYVSGKYAYVADSGAGLQIVDVSNPTAPSLTGTYDTSGSANSLYVSGKYAYVADYGAGLQIIDVSNPTAPSLTGTYDTSGSAFSVYVSGKYAYVADYGAGLQIIDVSNPSAPSLAGNYDTSGSAMGVYVSGKYAYVADYGAGLQIIDVSNPSAPSLAGNYNTGNATGVYVSGKYAYVAVWNSGLRIINVSNPTAPSLTGTYTSSGAWRVYVSGKYAYVANYNAGLQITDIDGIETPSLYAGNIQTNAMTITENLDIGNNLYVRNGLNVGPGGLYVDEGNVAFNTNTSTAAFSIRQKGTGDIFNVFDNTSNVFTILDGGNVSIGTTTPTYKLDVAGDINTTGTYRIAGLDYGQYFIDSAGTNGQVWKSDGSGRGYWGVDDTGTALPAGTSGQTLRHDGSAWVANSLLYNNGTNIGIGTTSPATKLHIDEDGGILAQGTYGSGWDGGSLGAGSRLMWIPSKRAFRAGYVGNNGWDASNIGDASVAMGTMTTASGDASTAMGYSTTASGWGSIAMGVGSIASGDTSTALGYVTTASGEASTAMGYFTTAQAYASTALGQYNVISGDSTTWVATDPIFAIGIGSGTYSRANAMTVLKSGNVGIGTTNPLALFSVGNSSQFRVDSSGNLTRINNVAYSWPSSQGAASTALVNDGAGNLSWTSAASLGTNYWDLENQGLSPTNTSLNLYVGGDSTASAKFIADGATGDGYFAGNVGVGTKNPTSKLQIIGADESSPSTNNGGVVQIGTTLNGQKIVFGGLTSSPYGSYIQAGGNTTYPLLLNPNGGNVGVGTTSPEKKFEVVAGGGEIIRARTGGSSAGLGIDLNSGNYGSGIWNSGTQQATFYNTGLTLGSYVASGYSAPAGGAIISGNVGIGTTTPSTLLQLGQAGKAGTLGIAGSTSGLVTLQTAAAAGTWTMTLPTSAGTSGQVLTTDGSGVTSWASAGAASNVALSGITAAISANSINSGDHAQTWNWQLTSANKVAFTFGENAASTATGSPAILSASTLASSTAMPLYIKNLGNAHSFRVDDEASDTTPFVIDASGNVGIGTASPTHKLDLGNNVNGPSYGIAMRTNATEGITYNVYTHSYSPSGVSYDVSYGGHYLKIAGTSRLTTTAAGTTLAGYIQANYSHRDAYAGTISNIAGNGGHGLKVIAGRASDGDEFVLQLTRYSDSVDLFSVLSSGNVGIGTTSPAYLLDVAGDINTTGTYRIAGIDYGQYFIDSAGTNGQVWKSDGVGRGYWGTDDTGTALPAGTSGQTIRHDGTAWVANSLLYNNGTNIGIGTTSPFTKLHIDGDGGILAQGTNGTGWDGGSLGAGSRLMWIPSKSAFRAGYVNGSQWNTANIGDYSVAMGYNTTASGWYSTAMGDNTSASGGNSTAMGYHTTASGWYSTAMGRQTSASGDYSTAMGFVATASGTYSTAMGSSTTASEWYSTAMGAGTTASGQFSTAMGAYTTAQAYASTVLGRFNVISGTTDSWVATDPIFAIGIGSDNSNRANAMTVLKSGNVGIGPTSPATKLHIDGDGGILAQGTYGSGWNGGSLGAGSRLMWIPSKSAFRAGYVDSTQWNTANIGDYSVAMGSSTIASGSNSTAMGIATTASGDYSTAMGAATNAGGDFSTAMGLETSASGDFSVVMGFATTASGGSSIAMGQGSTASGDSSVAMGYGANASGGSSIAMGEMTTASGPISTAMGLDTIASGDMSTAMGDATTAQAYASTVLGRYNVISGTAGSWVATDPIFVIGIGTSSSTRANAMTVLKNGNVGIGATVPSTLLQLGQAGKAGTLGIAGSSSGLVTLQTAANAGTWTMTLPTGTGTNGQVLTTNGSGVTSWTTVSGGGGGSLWSQSGSNIYYNGGNVGIGTNSPEAKLHLAGATQQQGSYPVVETSTSGQQTGNMWGQISSYNASLPTGIQAGDLLIIIVRSGGASTTYSLPGWTEIATRDNNGRTSVFAKIAQGSDTATITLGAQRIGIAHTAYRISGIHDSSSVTDVIEATFATTNTTDPPNLTASWTSGNNLFIAGMSTRYSTNNNISSAPTSFTNLLNEANVPFFGGDTTDHVRVGSAEREYATGSLNPGDFTTTGSIDNPHSLTIAVRSLMVEEEDLFRIDDGNGINKLIVKGSGNVGIGSTAPSTLLQLGQAGTAGTLGIAGSSSGLVTLQTAAAAGTWAMTLPTGTGTNGQVLTTNGSGVTSWTTVSGGGGGSLWSQSGSSIYYNGGNVGIGTNSPQASLHVNGNVYVESANNRTWGINNLASGHTVYFQFGGDANNRIENTYGSNTTFRSYHGTVFANNQGDIVRFGTASNSLNTNFFGNVGIGGTATSTLLQLGQAGTAGTLGIAGSSSGLVTIQTAAAAGTWTMTLPANTGSNGQVLTTNGSGVTSWTTVSGGGGGSLWSQSGSNIYYNGGNVGIGVTNPSYKLDVNGDLRAERFLDYTNVNYYLDPAAAGTSMLVAGNVGIGTTNPTRLLQLGQAGTAGTLGIAGSSSGLVTLQTAAAAGTWTMTLPANTGSNGQVLTTNGSGVTSWTTVSGGGGGSLWSQSGSNIYYTTGNVGIGTNSPATRLHIANDGGILAEGSYGSGWDGGSLGAGIRLMWIPSKSAFRAGYADGTQWNAANIGNYSVAMGYRTTASGLISTAMGAQTTATGTYSTAMGYMATTSGVSSTAMGYYTTAQAYASTVIGQYNVVSGTPGSWVSTDPVFVIGIGSSTSARANAMTVLKSGNVGIGTTAPTYQLQLSTNSAAKPSGGSWTNASDSRLKTNIESFTDGLNVITQINPVSYMLNGKGAMPLGEEGIGVIAQDIKDIAPYTVDTFFAKLNPEDEFETELYSFNSSALTFVLINAVKEQQLQLTGLDSALASQQGTDSALLAQLNDFKNSLVNSFTSALVSTQKLVAERIEIGGQALDQYIKSVVQLAINNNEINTQPDATENDLADSTETIAETQPTILSELTIDGDLEVTGSVNIAEDLNVEGTSQLGQLLADQAQIDQLQTQDLTTEQLQAQTAHINQAQINDAQIDTASVSGELYAQSINTENLHTSSIDADIINGLQERLQTAVANQLADSTLLASLINTNNNTEEYLEQMAAEMGVDLDQTIDGTLDHTNNDSLSQTIMAYSAYIESYFEVNGSALIKEGLAVGQTLMVGNGLTMGDGYIAYQSETSNDLAIQPAGRGRLSLMADLMTLDESGLVTINGNLKVAGAMEVDEDLKVKGTLLTNLISAVNPNEDIRVQLAQAATDEEGNETIKQSNFEFIDETGTAVATMSASGDLSLTGGLKVEQQLANASESTTHNNKSAGQAVILAGQTAVTIKTSRLTENSMIYITPLGSTKNQVIYVKSKLLDSEFTEENEAEFSVGFDFALDEDVYFNWWLVN